MKFICIVVFVVSVLLSVTACAPATFKSDAVTSDMSLELLPNWYHQKVGFQIIGANHYPENGALAKLLKDADNAFNNQNLQACQIFLERAQRISARSSGVYIRMSFLFWILDESVQAEQMARRALAVMGSDNLAKAEVKRLLQGIQSARY